MGRRKSFWKRLTGAFSFSDDDGEVDSNEELGELVSVEGFGEDKGGTTEDAPIDDDYVELPIDLYNTNDVIYVVAVIGGVKKNDLEIYVTRESLFISGKRTPNTMFSRGDNLISELYWGNFERRLVLPDEVDVDAVHAKEENGLLIIKLPKFNKHKKNRVKVE